MTVEIYNGASFYRFEMMDFDVSDGGGGGGGTANGSKIYLVERFVIGTELAWNLTMGDPLIFGRISVHWKIMKKVIWIPIKIIYPSLILDQDQILI